MSAETGTQPKSDRLAVTAPGKLYIAGEYAVTNPGSPAVLVAVDRCVTVAVGPAAGKDFGTIVSQQYPGKQCRWVRDDDNCPYANGDPGVFDFAFSALEWADRYLLEKSGMRGGPEPGSRAPLFDLSISSRLDAPDGTKYGLGSSAAVCVAVVEAVFAFWNRTDPSGPIGRGDSLDLRTTIFKLAAIAHLTIQGNGSLGDVASSAFGGWLLYHSFDRAWLRDRLANLSAGTATLEQIVSDEWPALGLEPLGVDPRVRLIVGWTGTPASTGPLVAKASQPVDPEDYRRFVVASAETVANVAQALRSGDFVALGRFIARNRSLLLDLASQRHVPIETRRLREGIEAALSCGLASKTSGAGRGDCLIALENSDAPADLDHLVDSWKQAGIAALDLSVAERGTRPLNRPSKEASSDPDPAAASKRRKEAHLRLADLQNRQRLGAERRGLDPSHASCAMSAGFDHVRLIRPTLPETRISESDISADFLGQHVEAPFFIEAMTGGTEHATRLNTALARIADRQGIALAFGSASLVAKDPSALDGFVAARSLTHFPVLANVNPLTPVPVVKRIVKEMRPDALQIHVNAVQELVMSEGDRDFRWIDGMRAIRDALSIPVIVKEVGFGWDESSVSKLISAGFDWIDIGGMGGTNFALIENSRRSSALGDYSWLVDCGVSTVRSLLNASQAARSSGAGSDLSVIASGGVRDPLDVLKSLALGAQMVGVAGRFLTPLLHGGEKRLDALIALWKKQLAGLYALYGIRTTQEARRLRYRIKDEATLA